MCVYPRLSTFNLLYTLYKRASLFHINSQVEMANTESDIAVTTDNKIEDVDQTTDVDKKEFSAEEKIVAPEAQPKSKKVWLERLILCVALFFPLFLATLDTSIYSPHLNF